MSNSSGGRWGLAMRGSHLLQERRREQLVRHLDSLIDQELVPKSQGTTGFLVDQSA